MSVPKILSKLNKTTYQRNPSKIVKKLLTQEESIWPYIEKGFTLKKYEDLYLDYINEEKEEIIRAEDIPKEVIKHKLDLFASTSKYFILDEKSGNVIEYGNPEESTEILQTLHEKGFVEFKGSARSQQKQFSKLMRDAASELKDATSIKRITEGTKNIQILKPFTIVKRLAKAPEIAYEPAYKFRWIKRTSPEEFETLTSYIAGL